MRVKLNIKSTTKKEISQREKENSSISRMAAAEGIVLLKNDGALPLKSKKVALYGAGARMTMKGGTGSGDVNNRYSVNIEEGLVKAGYEITTQSWLNDFDITYRENYVEWVKAVKKALKKVSFTQFFMAKTGNPFRLPGGRLITEQDIAESKTDTAIYVVARQAGEGKDRRQEKGDYQLTDVEFENIKKIAKAYENTIIVINAGGMVELSFMDEVDGINGLVYYVQAGQEGGNALADILLGKISPSGKLTDTWAREYADYPSAESFSYLNGNLKDEYYSEGIYVGYRYFDSFNITPRYEFGYGLSYTNFDIKTKKVQVEKTKVKITISVRNIGEKYGGKEVVQAYISCPQEKLNKEYQRLVAFVKTDSLEPNEYKEYTMEFDMSYCSSYWEKSAAWVLEAGNYILRIGNSSKNTTAAAVINLDKDTVIEKCENICPAPTELQEIPVPKIKYEEVECSVKLSIDSADFDVKKNSYEKLTVATEAKILNLLDKLSIEELASLVVGYDYMRSTKVNQAPGACGQTNAELYEKYGINSVQFADGPAGLRVVTEFYSEPDGRTRVKAFNKEDAKLSLILSLLNLMTSFRGLRAVKRYQYATAWPVATLLAQTWNIDLMYEVGKATGKEMCEFGVMLWLAPGMNIHRNPLCGRNFEYYSEDPFISGVMASEMTNGVQAHQGIGTTIKHFACNNQEDNREYMSSNLSERTLREIYLKGFEIAVKASRPKAVMTSYNRVNRVYTPNSFDLCTKVLRQEWGFDGLVMSDWDSTVRDRANTVDCITAGNDIIMPGYRYMEKEIVNSYNEGKISKEDLQRCAGNVLKLVLSSSQVVFKD